MGARTGRDARLRRWAGATLAALLLVTPAFVGITQEAAGAVGTPPTPQDDTFQFERKEAFDVLRNDTDTESDPLTVTSNTQPGNGTATCLPTGACTYTATAGFTGPDSFTYTVLDAGSNTATATVNLDITGTTPSENPPTPTPDEIVTKAGTPVTTNVLANDQSSSGTVAKDVGPTHGTATCTAAGSCTYTPTAGFVGYDGFRYTVTDTFGTATGTALITVVAANAGFDGAATGKATVGGGTSIAQGDSATWSIGAKGRPTFLPQQWATVNRPTVPVTLNGLHSLDPASVTTATGWTATPSGGGLSLTAGSTALLGEATTNALPPPLPPISQGTGGDGHVPILVGTKVYTFFHHSDPTSVSCIDRETGGVCPGYPHQLAINSSDIIGPGAVVGSRIYVSAFGNGFAQRAPYALYCWDTSTNETCGLIVAARVLEDQFQTPGVSAPRVVNGTLRFAADTGKLYCVDPSTNLPCATPSVPTGLPADTSQGNLTYDIVTHGSRVYVSETPAFTNGATVACIDVTTGIACTGWSAAKTLGARNLVNRHNAAGAADGVCAVDLDESQCIADATPATIVTAGAWPVSDDYYSVSEEAELGTRTLFATGLSDSGMGCWDWTTNALCTGGRWVDGIVRNDVANTGLPSAYGATSDGTCSVAVGDPGQVFTMDVNGASPCTSLSAGTVRRSVDLRIQRCDSTVGAATWADVRVLEANLTAGVEFDSLIVTVRDGTSGATLLTQQMVGTNGILSMTGINATTHPSLTLDATSESVGDNVPWADGNPPRLELRWNSDPADGCFRTTTVINCPTITPSSIGVVGTPAGGAAGTASLTMNPSPQCKALTAAKTGSGTGTGTVSSNPAGISCGATCTARYLSGTSITLSAAATAGSVFTGWSGGGCSGTGTCVVALSADTTVTANFELLRNLTVSKAGTGTGSVSSSPAGITCGATCSTTFTNSTSVTLTATPDASSTFTGWSGGGCSGTGTCVVALTADTTVTATFTLIPRTLTVTKAGTGTGSVTSSPAGISCGATCSTSFPHGTAVTLTATADPGSTFTGWSGGGCSGTGTCVVTLTAATSVAATFTLIPRTLTVSKAGTGTGSVTSSPAGITCGATCSTSFANGTTVTLSAAADAGSAFTGWSGGGCSGTSTCVVTLTADTTVTATFTAIGGDPSITVSKAGTGTGSVTSSPAGIICGATCSTTFTAGTVVTLTATPTAGSTFTGWTGNCTGTGTCIITLNSSAAVTATFEANRTLTVSKAGTGTGSVSSSLPGISCGATCSATYVNGTTLTLTATPDAGSSFAGWSGGGCTGTGTCVVTLTADTTVTATFTLIPRTLTVSKTGTGTGTVTSAPAGITCGASCSASYSNGTAVTLTATPTAGSTFAGWSGGGCTGTGTCIVTLTADTTVTATFTLIPRTLTVAKTGTGTGSVSSAPAGITCGATCSASYANGTAVTLTATPSAGSTFTGWSGACTGTSTCIVTLNADTTVTATFTLIPRTLTVSKAGTGTGTVTSAPAGITCGATCSASYANGTAVTLTATPTAGSTFAGWSGGGCTGTSTCIVTLTADTTVTATFTTNVTPSTNLRLQVQAPPTAGVGTPFAVTYLVSNVSTNAAPGSVLTATLPARLVLADQLPAGCTQPNGASSLSCALGTIGGGSQTTVRITVRSRVVGTACDVWGTSGNDTIVDTPGAHTICGLGGDDTITGADGNDIIIGDNPSDAGPFTTTISGQVTTTAVDSNPANNSASDSVDFVLGAPGNDTLNGGLGIDTIFGQNGADTLLGGAGADTLRGGNGNDDMSGQGGDDDLIGNAGNDTIRGGDGNDDISAGDGGDAVTGGNGNDTIHGGDGNDGLSGNAGNDTIYGEDGNDTINGNEDNDWLSGGLGNDLMEGASGNDTMFGGDGNDELHGGTGSGNVLDCGAGRDFASGGPIGEIHIRCNP